MLPDLSPLWISLKVTSLATLVTFLLGIIIAYRLLNYRGKWKSLIDGLCLSPLILPPTVIGFILLQILGKYGPIGRLLDRWHIDLIFTWYAAVIAATVVTFPLMYRTALGAFEQIDGNLLQAARTLGASEGRIFWQIALPLAWPGILAGATLAFARGLGEFGATLMIAGNIPGLTETMPIAIYAAVEAGNMSQAWAWSGVILSISLSVVTLANLWSNRRHQRRHTLPPLGPVGGVMDDLTQPAPFQANVPIVQSPVELLVNIRKPLAGFSLDIAFAAKGKAIAMMGASGAGKSMLLRCLAGMETPTHGQIILNGRVLFDAEVGINVPIRDRRIGFLFQNYALFPHLTVAQNIAFGLPQSKTQQSKARQSKTKKHTQKYSKQEIKKRVAEQLALVNLSGFGDRYPHQLSGGQQQRVALARTLASQPELLLLDEPFSALDTHLRHHMERQLTIILEQYTGMALLVTHNIEEAYRLCTDLLVVEQGKVIAYGPKQDIVARPRLTRVAQITGCKNFSRAVVRSTHQLEALDWNCTLHTSEPLAATINRVGIRAYQLSFAELKSPIVDRAVPVRSVDDTVSPEVATVHELNPRVITVANLPKNRVTCWLTKTSETPHRITLYLKLNAPPDHPSDYHLQAELFKEKWQILQQYPLPWQVDIAPERLILLSDDEPTVL